jgi:hypothetical protein
MRHSLDLDNQRPHASRTLERQHNWSDVIAIWKPLRTRLAGVDEIRSVRQGQPSASSVQPMSLESTVHGRRDSPMRDLHARDIATQGMGPDWYTWHHANGLHAPHPGETARDGRRANPERNRGDRG